MNGILLGVLAILPCSSRWRSGCRGASRARPTISSAAASWAWALPHSPCSRPGSAPRRCWGRRAASTATGLSGAQGRAVCLRRRPSSSWDCCSRCRCGRRGLDHLRRPVPRALLAGVERLVVILLVPGSVLWAAAQISGFGQIMDATTGMGAHGRHRAGGRHRRRSTPRSAACSPTSTRISCRALPSSSAWWRFSVRDRGPGRRSGGRRWPASRLRGSRRCEPTRRCSIFSSRWAIPICGSLVAVELISRVLACRSADVARTATGSAASATCSSR